MATRFTRPRHPQLAVAVTCVAAVLCWGATPASAAPEACATHADCDHLPASYCGGPGPSPTTVASSVCQPCHLRETLQGNSHAATFAPVGDGTYPVRCDCAAGEQGWSCDGAGAYCLDAALLFRRRFDAYDEMLSDLNMPAPAPGSNPRRVCAACTDETVPCTPFTAASGTCEPCRSTFRCTSHAGCDGVVERGHRFPVCTAARTCFWCASCFKMQLYLVRQPEAQPQYEWRYISFDGGCPASCCRASAHEQQLAGLDTATQPQVRSTMNVAAPCDGGKLVMLIARASFPSDATPQDALQKMTHCTGVRHDLGRGADSQPLWEFQCGQKKLEGDASTTDCTSSSAQLPLMYALVRVPQAVAGEDVFDVARASFLHPLQRRTACASVVAPLGSEPPLGTGPTEAVPRATASPAAPRELLGAALAVAVSALAVVV